MQLSCPLGTTRRVLQEKFPRKPYNKSLLTKLVRSRYWPKVAKSLVEEGRYNVKLVARLRCKGQGKQTRIR